MESHNSNALKLQLNMKFQKLLKSISLMERKDGLKTKKFIYETN